ncbi:MAG: DUF4433 domain-containing protein [Sulfurimonas sp.]|nr:DUF4433 domain-containing protein [Sulfurimonas sp.]
MRLNNYGFTSLDHMTHINNLDSIFKYGLQAHNNPYKKRDISNTDVNSRRERRENIYGRKVHDYVPFYFNPRNAMMYKNKDEDVVILAFNKKILLKNNVLFTNKNASTDSVHFYNDINDLEKINWDLVQSQSWNGKENAYQIKQTMMAEVLVYNKVDISNLLGIYCKDSSMKRQLIQRYNLKDSQVIVKPNLFFKY